MNHTLILLLALALAGAAHAQDIILKPLGEARLRYESVDQDGFALDADALTLRVRAGAEAKAAYHAYRSDRVSRAYGDEIDLLASAKLGKVTASTRYARYRADSFATDTDKFWLQLDWML